MPLDDWTFGRPGLRTSGPSDIRTFGHPDLRTCEQSPREHGGGQTRKRGPRMQWSENITQWTGLTFVDEKQIEEKKSIDAQREEEA